MTVAKQVSIWVTSETLEQKQTSEKDNEDKHRRYKRYRAAYKNCKCCSRCCTSPVMVGALIGVLIAGIGLAASSTLYLSDTLSEKTTTVTLTTETTITSTTTSVSTMTTTSSSSSSSSTSSTSTASTISKTTSTTSTTSTISKTTSTTSTSSTTSKTTATTVTTTTTTSTTTTAPYCTTRVTFDDIANQSTTTGVVPNGYDNLNWINIDYINTRTAPTSGYQTALSSSDYVAYNVGGSAVLITTANGTGFAFNSMILSSVWRDNLQWTLVGLHNGSMLVSATFPLFTNNQTKISCGGCSNWDTLYMESSGGNPHSGLSGNGTEFAFDDLCISFGY